MGELRVGTSKNVLGKSATLTGVMKPRKTFDRKPSLWECWCGLTGTFLLDYCPSNVALILADAAATAMTAVTQYLGPDRRLW